MINAVRNTVLYILNKDNNGYMTPDEFNMYAKQAQLELFEQYFYDYSRSVKKRNERYHNSGFGDIPKRIEEVIGSFYKEDVLPYTDIVTLPKFILPKDSYWTKDVVYNNTTLVDIVTGIDAIKQLQLLDAAPDEDYPIGVYYDNDNNDSLFDPGIGFQGSDRAITIYPATIDANVTCRYIRYPRDPKWTYTTIVNGDPVFNQSSSSYQDFELPMDDMENLVEMILGYAGVSIRDYPVAEIAQSYATKEKQLEQ
jgi:hypothetical protein